MLNLKALLIPETVYHYNQEMIDMFIDNELNILIRKQLESSTTFVLDTLFNPQKELELKGQFSLYCSVNTYQDLENKVKISINRYSPYLALVDKNLIINQSRVSKIKNKNFYEKFDFEFKIFIDQKMKMHSRLEENLKPKELGSNSKVQKI